ncbi:hypothetical protein ACLOJK_009794 [Asimina triloba]
MVGFSLPNLLRGRNDANGCHMLGEWVRSLISELEKELGSPVLGQPRVLPVAAGTQPLPSSPLDKESLVLSAAA